MSDLEWLTILTFLFIQGVLGAVAWFDLSSKLNLLLELMGQRVTGGMEPYPEPFVLTDSEAARVEQQLAEESHQREVLMAHSGRSSRTIR